MAALRTWHALGGACLFFVACDPYVRTTEIQLRDPSAVVATDVLSHTEVQTSPTSTSDLIVTSAKRSDGSIVTEWQTRMPILNGERHTLMDSKGTLVLEEHPPLDLGNDETTLHVCGTVAAHAVKGQTVGYDVRPAYPCSLQHMSETEVKTPRANVASVDYVSTNPSRPIAIFGAVVATVALGGLGSVFVFAPLKDKDGNDAGAAPKVVGVAMWSIAGAIDLALLPSIFAPNRRERIFPGA